MRFASIACVSFCLMAAPAWADDKPIEVMIVGTYHMGNPGLDLHNVKADDVLTPKRQKEIAEVAARLARFKPTVIAVEQQAKDPSDMRLSRYHDYLKGKIKDSRNEVVQLGFRTAGETKLKDVYGIDVDGDFPFEALAKFAQAHGNTAFLDRANKMGEEAVNAIGEKLKTSTVGGTLRYMNDPKLIEYGNEFYRSTLAIGRGNDQPGATLEAAWYARNFQICARLVQSAKPGDRVIVFYGAGHSFLLRQCVSEMPGYKLIEANDYLPQ
jgi:hypothetical protein